MSSKAKKLEQNVEANEKYYKYLLYNTLVGSIVCSIGKLCEITEDQMIRDFKDLENDEGFKQCKNILECCEFVKRMYGLVEDYEKCLYLVYDEDNRYTPICTILCEDGYLLPLDRDGNYTGILSQFGEKENIKIEEIYSEE